MAVARHAVVVGINKYEPSIGSLRFCAADARGIEHSLRGRRDGFHSTSHVLIVDEEAGSRSPTRSNIMQALKQLSRDATAEDTIIFHFSGHGQIGQDGKLYLLTADTMLDLLPETALSWDWIRDTIVMSLAPRRIVTLDACHSGAGRDAEAARRASQLAVAQLQLSAGDFACIASCGPGELSYEFEQLGHGLFSHFFCEGLSGGADPLGRGKITVHDLFSYTQTHTRVHAKRLGVPQSPMLVARTSEPLDTIALTTTSLDRPIGQVLIVSADSVIGRALEAAVLRSGAARGATWEADLARVTLTAKDTFNYDALFLDAGVGDNWREVRELILLVRKRYPIVPIVLVGQRTTLLTSMNEADSRRFKGYFFIDTETPIHGVMEAVRTRLHQVEWDIKSRYGERR